MFDLNVDYATLAHFVCCQSEQVPGGFTRAPGFRDPGHDFHELTFGKAVPGEHRILRGELDGGLSDADKAAVRAMELGATAAEAVAREGSEFSVVVRMDEVEESINIIEYALDHLPTGPFRVRVPRVVPAGEAVNRVDTGDGVAILTDMFGGTPSNLGMTFLEKDKLEVITGVNLPMLIKLARPQKAADLLTLAREMREHGRNAIWVASDLLKGEKAW